MIAKLIMEDYSIFMSEDMLSTIFYISKDKEKVLLFFETILSKWSVAPYGIALISDKSFVDCAVEVVNYDKILIVFPKTIYIFPLF